METFKAESPSPITYEIKISKPTFANNFASIIKHLWKISGKLIHQSQTEQINSNITRLKFQFSICLICQWNVVLLATNFGRKTPV